MLARSKLFFKLRTSLFTQVRCFSNQITVNQADSLPEPEVLLTEYGELVNVKPMKRSKNPYERSYKEVFMIDDNSSVRVIMKVLSHNKNCYFLFDPEGAHYTNSMSIYRAIRKKVFERYYGMNRIKADTVSNKNAFSKCKTPLDIFHRERNVRLNISQELGRIGYLVEKDFSLRIKGQNRPELKTLAQVIPEQAGLYKPLNDYKKSDYFLPSNMLYGMISSEEWEKNGIEILTLDNHMIYPLYGVWSPTTQTHLSLLDLFMKSLPDPSQINNVIDIGCGTGILGILAGKYGTSGELIGIDNFENAVECTKINSQVHGLGTKLKPILFDLTTLYHNKALFKESGITDLQAKPSLNTPSFIKEQMMYKKVINQLGMPSKYDLILANPPWLPASKLPEINPLDNGVYDPEEVFLKSSLNFARLHLSPEKRGRMLLIYSDLAQIIGLQKKNRIEDLIHSAGLFIDEVYETPMALSKKPYDPLVNYKAEAKVQMFEICKA
ncbi:unnamed protein product [Moneuplotes crassus]|uniref:Methyltransferase small domain-containing protein n=1 Tax=Euplotes crassus TaxID=5936 RepID=A0AAD1UHK0_EUPCR|nr:unnamed protein product [Moneuplotes crassus]